MKARLCTAIIAMGCGTAALAQTGTLDQVSPMTNAGFNLSASSLQWQQQVRVGVAGQLEGFELMIQGNAGAQFNARVRVGDGWNTGAIVFQNLYTKPNNGNELMFIDVTSANINLGVGDTFVIETQGNDTGAGLVGSYNPGSPLYPENLYLNGPGCFSDCGWRHGFNTYMIEGGGGLALELSGPCPGQVTVDISGATPGGRVAIVYGTCNGSTTIPGGQCAGTVLDVGGARLLRIVTADGNGNASASGNAPQGACGRICVQAVDATTCETSNDEGL
ncbi:MAG: hypothetical protein IT430_11160 [Phycisphaerales bacterium]|nr:hypothetical protein [Phycisphaerales bacterium]